MRATQSVGANRMSHIRVTRSIFRLAWHRAKMPGTQVAVGLLVASSLGCISVSDHRKPNEQRNASDNAAASAQRNTCGTMVATPQRETDTVSQLDCAATTGWTQNWTPWDIRIPRSGVFGRDCQLTKECEEKGWCAGHGSPNCYAATEKSCRESFYCSHEGMCVVSGKICIVADDSDCEKSAVCRKSGQCTLGNGRCVATSEQHCRSADNCREYGLCMNKGEICVAEISRDCREADICTDFGQCHAVNGGCYALGARDCEATCKLNGRCYWDRGTCVARSDADCWPSKECMSDLRCHFFEGQCVTEYKITETRRVREETCKQIK